MKLAIPLALLVLTGCSAGWTQDDTLHNHFRKVRDKIVGLNIDLICGDKCKKEVVDKNHYEYSYGFVSKQSKYKGVCTTFYKVKKSGGTIVSWRYEGRKYDCLSMP